MNSERSPLLVTTTPFEKRRVDTPKIMRHVILALVPVMLAAVYYFGAGALLIIATCTLTCVLTEWLLSGRGPFAASPVTDGSAAVTGILLALALPPGLPLWMAALGAVVAMVFGKLLFGGLGQNVFNPSLTGRAFLQACFPVALTSWSEHSDWSGFERLRGDLFAAPFRRADFDAVSSATPLARMKFEGQAGELWPLFDGSIPGSLGETAAVLILIGGLYLAARQFINWRIPVGIFASVYVVATLLQVLDPQRFPGGLHHLLAGGLMLGAVFMATDPVTSPVTPRGCWIFAAGIGVLVVVIRQFGGLPEGVMYAILLMNAATPLIDRLTQPAIYGGGGKRSAGGVAAVITEATPMPPPALVAEPISGARMVAVMGSIGVLAAVLLVFTYLGTGPAIERNRAAALERAIFQVLPGATSKLTFSESDGSLSPATEGEQTGRDYYAGYDANGALVGVAIAAQGQGFQDVLRVLYGYSPRCRCVVGFKVLESKETPGLGDKIETDPVFTANFEALDMRLDAAGAAISNPLELVKRGQKTTEWQVEGITGATISARAVTRILSESSASAVLLIERNLEVLMGCNAQAVADCPRLGRDRGVTPSPMDPATARRRGLPLPPTAQTATNPMIIKGH